MSHFGHFADKGGSSRQSLEGSAKSIDGQLLLAIKSIAVGDRMCTGMIDYDFVQL